MDIPTPKQSDDPSEHTIVGNDVKALFPSLRDHESARVAREAIESSNIKLENIAIIAALKYLRIVGGDEDMKAICQLTDYLKFTGEDNSMFKDATFPTLDTILWMENGKDMHKFIRKAHSRESGVTQRTALPSACLR